MAVVISGNGIDMGGNPVSNASQIDSSLINASQVDSTEIVISETTWNNPDGVEYADSGIQGVPDTSFSSTGARMYPDGTIRGKSSYGEYVKYPDGRLECTMGASTTSTILSVSPIYFSDVVIAYYPYIFVEVPIVVASGSRSAIDNVLVWGGTRSKSTTYVELRSFSTTSSAITRTMYAYATGSWK